MQHELEHAASTKEPAATKCRTLESGKLKGAKRNLSLDYTHEFRVFDVGTCLFVMPKIVAHRKSPEYDDECGIPMTKARSYPSGKYRAL